MLNRKSDRANPSTFGFAGPVDPRRCRLPRWRAAALTAARRRTIRPTGTRHIAERVPPRASSGAPRQSPPHAHARDGRRRRALARRPLQATARRGHRTAAQAHMPQGHKGVSPWHRPSLRHPTQTTTRISCAASRSTRCAGAVGASLALDRARASIAAIRVRPAAVHAGPPLHLSCRPRQSP